MNSFKSLSKKIDNAKALDFSDLFDSIFALFKKVWIKGFLVVLLIVVFAMGINIVFSLIGLAPQNTMPFGGYDINTFVDFYSKSIILSIPQTILVSTISMALVAAFYRICRNHVMGVTEPDDYFYFFKKAYFSKLLMLGIIHTGIAVVAQFLLFIPYIYVFVPLSYFTIIFANNPELSEAEIVKASFKLGTKKWLISFGTLFVAGIIAMLGILGCGIGLLFTMSIIYLPVFFIYKEVVGFDTTSEIEQIEMGNDYD
jgi:hypothetical protein